jgi:hypothetical protein
VLERPKGGRPPTPCLCQVAVPDVDLRLVDAHVNPVFLIFKILRSVGLCFLKFKNRTVEGVVMSGIEDCLQGFAHRRDGVCLFMPWHLDAAIPLPGAQARNPSPSRDRVSQPLKDARLPF